MRRIYNDLDISFSVEGVSVHALNIVFERFTRTIPPHTHGSGCYEIHYIPFGNGRLKAEGQYYDVTPNTLFVTGPQIEHAQIPLPEDPMQEYCVYFKIGRTDRIRGKAALMETFTGTAFWYGQDTQGLHLLMRRLFAELEGHYIGYQEQVRLLLAQLILSTVRNYQQKQLSRTAFAPNNLTDSKSVIIEESFLYEYRALTLDALAKRLRLSPRQTQRLLMEHYGKSFQQKKKESRMAAAAILLTDTDRSIASIAEELGYSSAEHFSSAFRNYYQTSPGTYRKKPVTRPDGRKYHDQCTES